MTPAKLAKLILDDYDARRPGRILATELPKLSVRDAYELQFAVASLRRGRGERVAGYKIGCISPTMQRQLGIRRPVFGHVWESELFESGIQLSASAFDGLAIEGELAIRLQENVTSSDSLRNNPEVISTIQPVIELHNYIFHEDESFRAVELIANNAIHAGVVKSDEECDYSAFETNTPLVVQRNSVTIGESVVAHLQHGAIEIVASLSDHLAEWGERLEINQIILTGSPLPLWTVFAGECIDVRWDGLKGVRCTIA